MIPWQGSLKFRTYSPGKITKYGVLVRMVCEAVSGYICNMAIFSAEGEKLEDKVLSLLPVYMESHPRISRIETNYEFFRQNMLSAMALTNGSLFNINVGFLYAQQCFILLSYCCLCEHNNYNDK